MPVWNQTKFPALKVESAMSQTILLKWCLISNEKSAEKTNTDKVKS